VTMKREDFNNACKYAWDWFRYHANQRLVTFYYFLIVFGAMAYAYGWAYSVEQYQISFLITIFAAIASICFLALEIRNAILVDDARRALDKMEEGFDEEYKIRANDQKRFKNITYYFISHTIVLRSIMSFSIAISFYASYLANAKGKNLDISYLRNCAILGLIILMISIFKRIIIDRIICPICNMNKK